jgi:hypothetical protein
MGMENVERSNALQTEKRKRSIPYLIFNLNNYGRIFGKRNKQLNY